MCGPSYQWIAAGQVSPALRRDIESGGVPPVQGLRQEVRTIRTGKERVGLVRAVEGEQFACQSSLPEVRKAFQGKRQRARRVNLDALRVESTLQPRQRRTDS